MRLNLGCGPGLVLEPSYVYIDASRKLLLTKIPIINLALSKFGPAHNSWDKRVKFKNILKLKMSPGSVQSVYSSHLLEHLYFNQCQTLISEIFKALEDDGILRLALPDYDAFVLRFTETQKIDSLKAIQEFEAALLSHPLTKPKLSKRIWNILAGDLHIHRWHPNYAIMKSILEEAGFKNIKRCNFQESALEGITNLENRNEMTFYIEATK
jgi:predicted SAM-dependent methyltransferase